MPSSGARAPEPPHPAGLCARCAHAARQDTARGSVFWRCRRAETDPRFVRYPRLPVLACPGYEPAPAPAAS
jgi:hypothetical protein